MKKQLKILLSVILILSVLFTSAFAVPGNGKSQITKQYTENLSFQNTFDDITGFDWAQKSIKTMSKMGIIKGEGNNKFSPARSAKEIEVIIMALRFMGEEINLDAYSRMPKNYKGKSPDNWMVSYIDLAIENGILHESELDEFNPNRSASRSQAAVYIARALDMVGEAESRNNDVLPFKDANSVPVEHIGYVALMNDLGLMIGYNGSFHPNKPVTRAELAVLFNRMHNISDTDYAYTVYGRISNITSETVKIKIGSKYFEYALDESVDVFENDLQISLDDLSLNDFVRLHIVNDEVMIIDLLDNNSIIPNKIYLKLTGELTDYINNASTGAIEGIHVDLDNDGATTDSAFTFDSNIIIKVEGMEDDLLESHIGLKVVLYTVDGVVFKLYLKYYKFLGVFYSVKKYKNCSVISVDITPDTTTSSIEYTFAPDVQIFINDVSSDLDELADLDFDDEIIYNVDVKLLGNGKIIKMSVDFDDASLVTTDYTAELVSFTTTTSGISEITVVLDGHTTTESFIMADSYEIMLNSSPAALNNDYLGTNIVFTTNNSDKVIEINLPELIHEYEGTFKSYDTPLTSISVILTGSTTVQAFEVASGAAIVNTSDAAIGLSSALIDSPVSFFTNYWDEVTKIIFPNLVP